MILIVVPNIETIIPQKIIVPFLILWKAEQFGYLTNISNVAGVIKDRNAIITDPFKDMIKSISGVAAAARTGKYCIDSIPFLVTFYCII